MSIAELFNTLPAGLEFPVIDKTGLTGKYDFHLEFVPETKTPGVSGAGDPNAPPSVGPSIFEALQQQLGLRLELAKGPVDILVIDHVERPSEN